MGDTVARQLGRAVVARVRPDELAVFDDAADAFLADPARARPTSSTGGGDLSADLGPLLMTLTTAVMFVVTAILNLTTEKGTALVAGWVLRWARRNRGRADVVPSMGEVRAALTDRHTDLRTFIVSALVDSGHRSDWAESIADDLVAAFTAVLSAPGEDSDEVGDDPDA